MKRSLQINARQLLFLLVLSLASSTPAQRLGRSANLETDFNPKNLPRLEVSRPPQTAAEYRFRFRVQGEAGRAYVIEASTNLLDWKPVGIYQTDANAPILELFDSKTPAFPQRFYRAFLQPKAANLSLNPSIRNELDQMFSLLPLSSLIPPPVSSLGGKFRTDHILIKPRKGVLLSALAPVQSQTGSQLLRIFPDIGNLSVVRLRDGADVRNALAAYQFSGLVEYAEPDYLVRPMIEPNDFRFRDGSLWNLHNVGQSGGRSDADIDAPEAWDIRTSAENIIVAIIDTGVRFTHEDLGPNMWRNSREIAGNGVDDDNNGWVDDVHGINAIQNNGNPSDDHGHGSHVAGIVGAAGNNGVGVAGVAWKVQLMACKFIAPSGEGTLSDAITCINYARNQGAKIINASWGLPEFNSQALRDTIDSARNAGIIFAAAAGNTGANNDDPSAVYPASFDLDNIISVLATTRGDDLAFFSNFGPTNVDIGAPGLDIFSCWTGTDSSYQQFSGTSMAAAHVSGACALAWAAFPNESYRQIVSRVLSGADPVAALAGRCVTGGRLNLHNILTSAQPQLPPPALPTVTVVASDAQAAEAGADAGEFTLSRTGDTSAALRVKYALNGTAVNGTDYQTLQTSVTIPAGSASATVTVVPVDDTTVEGNETVVLTLSDNAAYTVGSPNIATVTIADNDTATLPVTADFTANPTSGVAPLTVQFSDKSGGPVARWDWNFGDGTARGTAQNPSHLFSSAGDFTVTLTVTGGDGATSSKTQAIRVTAPAPQLPAVTVTATDANASETGSDPAEFTFTRTGSLAPAVTVQYELTGSAIKWNDYRRPQGDMPDFITIPAGASSAKLVILPVDDREIEGSETVNLRIISDNAYTVGSPNSASALIADDDAAPAPPPTAAAVSVRATDHSAAEAGRDPGEFTINRTGDTSAAFTVRYILGGTARNGADYQSLAESITIPAGAPTAVVRVVPIDDLAVEGLEEVILTLKPDPSFTIGSPDKATVQIIDDELDPVIVIASDPLAAEAGLDAGQFTITRSGGDMNVALTVRYNLSGSASNGADYQSLAESITIPGGVASAVVKVVPIDDSIIEGSEDVVLTIKPDPAYVIGSPDRAAVVIADNDQPPPTVERPIVTVEATDPNAAEAGQDTGTFTIRLSGRAASPITVRYTMGEEAKNGVDYQTLGGTVTIPAGTTSATVTVIPIDDSITESNEPLMLMLFGYTGAPYLVGRPDGAVVTIADNDQLPVRPVATVVASDAQASEAGDTGTFTIRLSSPAPSPITVRYTMGEEAKNGVDYQTLSGTVTIPAGSSSATVTVVPINDSADESNEPLMLMLFGYTGAPYTVGRPDGAVVTITDND